MDVREHSQPMALTSTAVSFGSSIFVCVVAVVFLASAASKSVDPNSTTLALQTSLGVPAEVSRIAWLTLIAAEAGLASWLICGVWRAKAIAVSMALLLCFSGFVVYLLVTGSQADCGCGLPRFVDSIEIQRLLDLGRNGIMAAGLAAVLYFEHVLPHKEQHHDMEK